MVDMPLDDRPLPGALVTARSLKAALWLLLAFFLCWGCWAAVREATQNRCETMLGRLSVQLKLDSYFSRCQCMNPSLDFSDPCNTPYIAVLL
jgi:hypothetical protein